MFIKGKKVFIPKKDYYEGNTYKFFKTKIKKITKKNILVHELKKYDEFEAIVNCAGHWYYPNTPKSLKKLKLDVNPLF